MDVSSLKVFLLWSLVINYIILIVWFGAFVFARGWMYRIHGRWFRIPQEQFDAIHYTGMAVYKIGILLLDLTPLLALVFIGKQGG